jgi:hypothetical protein
MRIGFIAALAVFASSLAPTAAVADTWSEPKVAVTASANGAYRLTVTPRTISDQIDFFEDKVAGREPAGQADGQPGTATARLERRTSDGNWSLVWDRPLVNDVAPVSALVSDDGRYVVTFDNWHSVGYGDDVVAIYGGDGTLIRAMALTDILPSYFLDGFSRTVSSLHWQHQSTRISGDLLQLAVREPGEAAFTNDSKFYTLNIRLDTGTPAPLTADQLRHLRPLACSAHRAAVQDYNEGLRWVRSDLTAPTTGDRNEWSRYYSEAIHRLLEPEMSEADAADLLPFELLAADQYMSREFRDGFREALRASAAELRLAVFAAVDQARLVEEVERSAQRMAPGSLAGRDLYFFADSAHWPRIVAALAGKGATLHQIDTDRPIPQRADVIAAVGGRGRVIDPACASVDDTDGGASAAVTIAVGTALLASMAVAIGFGRSR